MTAPMTAERAVYLDSSALVKLVVQEPETPALTSYLRDHPNRVSCGLARVEVVRAVRSHGAAAADRARRLLARVGILALDDILLDDAARLEYESLRSLDAIHLAAARTLGDSLVSLVTYDRRMAEAASNVGVATLAPG